MKFFHNGLCHISRIITTILFDFFVIPAISIFWLASPPSMATEIEAGLVQIIDTSSFPSPDPAGIAYLPSQDAFLISDSEINEMPIFQGANVFKVDRHGNLLETFSTLDFSDEPTGVTINPSNKHCFFSDDTTTKLTYEVDPGPDAICLTSDDSVTAFDFGIADPEDVTYGLDSLFIVDGANDRVYRIKPGANGVFDNYLSGDDESSYFDIPSQSLFDPEGLVFNSTNNTLFIVGNRQDVIVQTTTEGILLRTINMASINPNMPAGLALAPSSEDPSITSLYLVARGVDNDSDANENDGAIYELTIPALTLDNEMPVVSAGKDLSITLANNAQLEGSVSDDGLPGSTLTSTWSKHSGPGEVSFNDPNNLTTTASFSLAGTYILRLTGDDGELYSFDDLSISVESPSSTILNVPVDYPTIQDAIVNAVEGDTILLAPGNYQLNDTFYINKNNITIASRYLTSRDKNDIDTTIIKGDQTKSFLNGVLGQSANLKLIGLTITDVDKGVTFADDYGEVRYCKFYNTLRDAISFDSNAGGAVTHTRVENAGDDAIDIDTRYNGSFLIAYNELIDSGDDSIEVHLYNSVSAVNMHYDIHDNLLSGAREDGIQLIDYDRLSKRTFDIYRNIFQGMTDVAISSMFEETKENFQGAPMAERVRIYNNYFYNNGYHITGGDNMIILNNIFEAASYAAIKRVKNDSITDYNLFYNNPIDTEDTLTGNNNHYTDPQRNNDFTLQLDSPGIDAGTPSYTHLGELVLQIAGSEYAGQKPDIGRYEYAMNNAAPVLTLTDANPVRLDVGEIFTDPGATAADNADGDITAAIQTISNVDTAVAGSYLVTYTVSDSDGNSTSASRSVIVRDNTIAPQITLLGANPLKLNLNDLFTDPGAIVSDDSDGDITDNIKITGKVDTAVAGSYLLTYTITDADGNSASTGRSVLVRDNTIPPVLTLLGANPLKLNLGDSFSDPGATAMDDTDADISASIQSISNVDTNLAGSYSVTYTVNDSDGNSASASRNVLVRDNTIPPVLTLLGANPLKLNLGDTFSDPGATAMDDIDADISASIQSISNVDTNLAGSYSVTYTVTDSDGNSASASRNVLIRDNTIPPVLTLLGANPLKLNLGDTFSDPGATAMDDTDADISAAIQSISNVDTNLAGSYLVTYTVNDSDGNSASASRNVLIRDNTIPPVLTLLGANPLKLNLSDTFSDPGATAVDDTDADISVSIQTISNVDTNLAGSYLVIYTVSDSDGNRTSADRSVVVRDNTIAPVLTLLGANPLNLNLGDTFSDPGATAVDDTDADISTAIQTISNVDTNLAGSYLVTYTVSDSDGNRTSADRSVVVRDNTIAPVITLLGDNPMNINLGDTFTDPGATAVDDRDGDLTVAIRTVASKLADTLTEPQALDINDIIGDANVDTSIAGSYLITYTVTDSDGNSASASRSVIVNAGTNSISTSGGGGSSDRNLLLLIALLFLFRHRRKGKFR